MNPMGPHVEREFTMFASKICMAGLLGYKHPFHLKADLLPSKLFSKGGRQPGTSWDSWEVEQGE